jgi:hypothetical protein
MIKNADTVILTHDEYNNIRERLSEYAAQEEIRRISNWEMRRCLITSGTEQELEDRQMARQRIEDLEKALGNLIDACDGNYQELVQECKDVLEHGEIKYGG